VELKQFGVERHELANDVAVVEVERAEARHVRGVGVVYTFRAAISLHWMAQS
jgi:hypothetical protein